MIERVARALCVELGEDPDQQTPFHPRISYLWQHYIKAARAAIEAMREADGQMTAAGIKRMVAWEYGETGDVDEYPACKEQASYTAMIDAALKEQP